jgi:hypothetical protein
MSGKITQRRADGPIIQGHIEFHIKDDFRLLHQVTAWPDPASPITDQSLREYVMYSGNAETIVKEVVTHNMGSRLGLPVAVAANLNRGSTVPDGVTFRFHPLYERLFPAVEKAGIGVTFKQSGSAIVCDVYQPGVFARTLSEASGTIITWSWSDDDAQATRAISGGQGEGTARAFNMVADTALEAAHNEVFEVFRDARDAEDPAVLPARAQETLDENAPRSGFAISLSETEHFQYGKDGLVVGAEVTIDLGFVTRTDILRECTLVFSRDEGAQVTPIVGDINDNPDRTIAKFLAQLKKGIADLKVSK